MTVNNITYIEVGGGDVEAWENGAGQERVYCQRRLRTKVR